MYLPDYLVQVPHFLVHFHRVLVGLHVVRGGANCGGVWRDHWSPSLESLCTFLPSLTSRVMPTSAGCGSRETQVSSLPVRLDPGQHPYQAVPYNQVNCILRYLWLCVVFSPRRVMKTIPSRPQRRVPIHAVVPVVSAIRISL